MKKHIWEHKKKPAEAGAILYTRIRKQLKRFTLNVAFSCEKGQLLALVGPSGAGKSTIIRIIAGLEQPDDARITLAEEVWVDTSARISIPTRERGVGYVFQEFTQFPNLSVYNNVAFAARNKKYVEELLRMFDIHHLRNSRPGDISGGEQQRCAICQALAREPRVLLMDEPFSALDALNRRKLRALMKSIKRELKIPIIHVTHDIREAVFMADDMLPVVQGHAEPKWTLQFMLSAREFDRSMCKDTPAGGMEEEHEDRALSIEKKEGTP